MPRTAVLRGVCMIAAIAASAHVAWSVAMVQLLAASYEHRIFDVTRWPSDLPVPAVRQLVAAFTADRLRGQAARTTVFLGSSFMFGYAWQESVVLSKRYALLRPTEAVLNISVIGAGLRELNGAVLCGVRDAGQPIGTAVVEIPVVNSVSLIVEGEPDDWQRGCLPDVPVAPYLRFAIQRPIGIAWIPFIWDPYAYDKRDEDVVLAAVPKGYFVTSAAFHRVRDRYQQLVAASVLEASRAASRVVVFPSPVYLSGAAELGEDAAAIRAQLDAAVAACRSVAGVTCLDPAAFYERRDLYYNMTHLNRRGHQQMAEWLAERVR